MNSNQFKNIVKKGVYYYPAWKHFGLIPTNVACDRCNKNNLIACIGYQDNDLCLDCVENVTKLLHKNNLPVQKTQTKFKIYKEPPNWNGIDKNFKNRTFMVQDMFNNNNLEERTYMVQDMFNNNNLEERTFMMQDMFNDK